MKTIKDKRMVKLELYFFQNYIFWTYIKKIGTFTFKFMIIPRGSHLVYT